MSNRTIQLIDALIKELAVLRAHRPTLRPDATLPGTLAQVAADLRTHPGSSRGQIAERLGLQPKVVSKALYSLAQSGLAWYVGERRGARWEPSLRKNQNTPGRGD